MQDRSARAFVGGFALIGGVAAPLVLHEWLLGAILAVAGGLIAGALIFGGQRAPAPRPAEPSEDVKPAPEAPPLPNAADIISAIDDPMLIVRNRRVLMANAEARKILGEHIEGVDVRLAIRHPAAAERLTSSAEEGTESHSKTELIGLGERERRWEMTTDILKDGSRMVRLNDRSAVHASEQMRGDFVANASHELRTPLATILGFIETLQDDDAAADPKTRSRFLGIMFEEARRMQQLVNDLISLSRIEAERFSPPREAVPLVAVAEEVRLACRHVMDGRQSELVLENEELAPEVLGDRAQLLQLLQNLVMNALKYGRAGTPVRVRFDEAGPDMLRMSVIDQGEGVAPEHLPRLTERFYRVDAGRSRSVGGTGLGLAIVKHIVGRHRGRLEIRSRLGEGTSVRVYLPKAPGATVTPLS